MQACGTADPNGMWKTLLIAVLLVGAAHFAVRYLRTNPLDPVVEGGEVVVETNEYEVLLREGELPEVQKAKRTSVIKYREYVQRSVGVVRR